MNEGQLRKLNCDIFGCQDFSNFKKSHNFIPDDSGDRGAFEIHDSTDDTPRSYGETDFTALLHDAVLETYYGSQFIKGL
ncbi:hypothetical protein IQ243_28670 [Nostocales cyanobacterium LEGE 11386]|nr:hypothetical protein [Nostocales cyanobacterium LEGE 11386]